MPSKTRKTSSSKPKTWGTRTLNSGTKRKTSSRSTSSKSGTSTRKPANSHRNTGPKRKNNKKRSKHPILKWILIIGGIFLGLGIAAFAYLYITTSIPEPEDVAVAQKTTVYYADGTTPVGSFSESNREIIECDALPDYVGNAVVASENRSFWTDHGLDFRGIGRALINNVTKGTRQGGSTITQQYAERYYLGQTGSYLGKLREAILAIKIAQTQEKSTVLCNYMNTIFFGRDADGIEAAAKNYFGKSAKDLTLDESVLIAGIIPAPNAWDPAVDKEQAQQRFDRTIGIMKEDGYITADQAAKAKLPETIKYERSNIYQGDKGYILQMVKNELTKDGTFTEDELETGGYDIVATIDAAKQAAMQTAGKNRAYGEPEGIQQGDISVDPRDGSIYALYAGDDYITHPLNNATQAQFQPGSTMKPFTLLAAIQQNVSLDTRFNGNSPRTFAGLQKSVSNAGDISYGSINLYTATAESVNTVFMDLNEHVTPKVSADTAHTAGIESDIDEASPYNVLGINSITALDLARGHATIANGGLKPTLHIVKAVKNSAGEDLYKAPTETTRVFEANDTALVIKAMRGVVTNGTGAEASSLGRPIAGKTGTSNDGTSVSFVGYTPQMVSIFALWYPDADGNPQELPTTFGGYYGSAYPVHLFTLYSQQAFQGMDVEQFPTGVDDGKVGGPDGTWGYGRAVETQPTVPRDDDDEDETQGNNQDQQSGDGDGGSGGDTDSDGSDGTGSENGTDGGTEGEQDNPGQGGQNGQAGNGGA